MPDTTSPIDSGDGVFIGVNIPAIYTQHASKMTTSFIAEMTEQELQIIDLTMVNCGGKKAKTKVGTWIKKNLGDGDGTHEGSDYIDEVFRVVGAIIAGKVGSNVNQPPGSEEPGPGVWY